jgi:hypothetical protein
VHAGQVQAVGRLQLLAGHQVGNGGHDRRLGEGVQEAGAQAHHEHRRQQQLLPAGDQQEQRRRRRHQHAAGHVRPGDHPPAVNPVYENSGHRPQQDHGQHGQARQQAGKGPRAGGVLEPQQGREGEGVLSDRADQLALPQQGERAVPETGGRLRIHLPKILQRLDA